MYKKKNMFIATLLSTFLMANNITVYANVEVGNNIQENELNVIENEDISTEGDALTETEEKEETIVEVETETEENNEEINEKEESDITLDDQEEDEESDNLKDEVIKNEIDNAETEVNNTETEVNNTETESEVNDSETQSEEISTYAISYEREPNNAMNQANVVGVNNNTYYNGYLSSSNDVDYFKVSLSTNAELSISFANSTGSSSWNVQILNEKNEVVDEGRHSGPYGSQHTYRKVGLPKGNYYIKVFSGSVDATYSFKLTAKTNINTELEFNNNSSTANILKLGATTHGTLQSYRDRDYFKIVLPKNGILELDMILGNGFDLNFELFTSGGTVLRNKHLNYATNVYRKIGLKAGTYYLKISPTSTYYDLPKEYKNHHYSINAKFTEHSSYEIEFNNSKETATPMTLNKKYYGDVFNDEDYFRFNVSNPTKVQLQIAQNSKIFSFRITDSYGNIYADLNNINGNYYSPNYINLPKGNYYAHVRNGSGDYNFELREAGDWRSHWANNEIRNAMQKGWINSSDTFRPNEAITRAEFIKIVNKAFGFTKKSYNIPFKDVSSKDWWYSEVQIAIGNGYISTGNTNFRPRDPITREEVANIITTITKTKDSNLDKLNKYTDKHLVSKSATSSVEGAIEQGYMGVGSNKFRPKDKITRAEAIVTLTRVSQK